MIELRCHSCSHAIGTTVVPVKLVAIFKPSAVGRFGKSHTDEIRRRCRHCGWVNVFHPEQASRFREIELKHASPGRVA